MRAGLPRWSRWLLPTVVIALVVAGCSGLDDATPGPGVATGSTSVEDLAAARSTPDIDSPATGVDSAAADRSTAGSVRGTSSAGAPTSSSAEGSTPSPGSPASSASSPSPASSAAPSESAASGSDAAEPSGTFTLALAGDVNFAERTEGLLADPSTAFGEATAALSAADLTMLNLETAVTENGDRQNKQFTFKAPPTAFAAMEAAGVDVVSMANNHAADYGNSGLADTLTARDHTPVAVVGVGWDAAEAYAPHRQTINGVPVALFAATAYRDLTFREFSAEDGKAGVANAFSPRLVEGVQAAAAAGETVVVYLHWGTEYTGCPDGDQQELADQLSAAGAAAVVGTHAHQLQGAGWRADGTYVAYGLGNYLWWRSFGNEQDDNGVLTLTFTGDRVTAASFDPARLDDRGIPVPAVDPVRSEILADWEELRGCTDLGPTPP